MPFWNEICDKLSGTCHVYTHYRWTVTFLYKVISLIPSHYTTKGNIFKARRLHFACLLVLELALLLRAPISNWEPFSEIWPRNPFLHHYPYCTREIYLSRVRRTSTSQSYTLDTFLYSTDLERSILMSARITGIWETLYRLVKSYICTIKLLYHAFTLLVMSYYLVLSRQSSFMIMKHVNTLTNEIRL